VSIGSGRRAHPLSAGARSPQPCGFKGLVAPDVLVESTCFATGRQWLLSASFSDKSNLFQDVLVEQGTQRALRSKGPRASASQMIYPK